LVIGKKNGVVTNDSSLFITQAIRTRQSPGCNTDGHDDILRICAMILERRANALISTTVVRAGIDELALMVLKILCKMAGIPWLLSEEVGRELDDLIQAVQERQKRMEVRLKTRNSARENLVDQLSPFDKAFNGALARIGSRNISKDKHLFQDVLIEVIKKRSLGRISQREKTRVVWKQAKEDPSKLNDDEAIHLVNNYCFKRMWCSTLKSSHLSILTDVHSWAMNQPPISSPDEAKTIIQTVMSKRRPEVIEMELLHASKEFQQQWKDNYEREKKERLDNYEREKKRIAAMAGGTPSTKNTSTGSKPAVKAQASTGVKKTEQPKLPIKRVVIPAAETTKPLPLPPIAQATMKKTTLSQLTAKAPLPSLPVVKATENSSGKKVPFPVTSINVPVPTSSTSNNAARANYTTLPAVPKVPAYPSWNTGKFQQQAKKSTSYDDQWNIMFQVLQHYIEDTREKETKNMSDEKKSAWVWDGNVPTYYQTPCGKLLGRWVNNQRTAKSNGTLDSDREERLNSLGLKLTSVRGGEWEQSLQLLEQYAQEQTTDDIPWDVSMDCARLDNLTCFIF